MGMYQGGYGNFAAKRAARHGKTKQYKAALEQKQNSNNSSVKQVENTKNTPTESNKSKERPYTGCLLYTSPSPRDYGTSRMPSSA